MFKEEDNPSLWTTSEHSLSGIHNEVNVTHFNDSCRLCLTRICSGSGTSISRVVRKVRICCGLRASKNDSLPQNICYRCYHSLQLFFMFKEQCKKVDRILRQKLELESESVRPQEEKGTDSNCSATYEDIRPDTTSFQTDESVRPQQEKGTDSNCSATYEDIRPDATSFQTDVSVELKQEQKEAAVPIEFGAPIVRLTRLRTSEFGIEQGNHGHSNSSATLSEPCVNPIEEEDKTAVETRTIRKSQRKRYKKVFEPSGGSSSLKITPSRFSERRAASSKNKIKKAAGGKMKTVSSNTMCLLKSSSDPLEEKKASAPASVSRKDSARKSKKRVVIRKRKIAKIIEEVPISWTTYVLREKQRNAKENPSTLPEYGVSNNEACTENGLVSSQKELMSALSLQMTNNSMASPVNMQSETRTVQGVDLPPNGEQNSLSLQNEKNDMPTPKQVSPVSTRERKVLVCPCEVGQKPIVLPQADVTLTVPQQIEQKVCKEKCKSSLTLRKKKVNFKTLQQKQDKVVDSIQEEDSLERDYLQQFKKCLISVNTKKTSVISTEKEQAPPVVSPHKIVKSVVSHQKELDTSSVVPQQKGQKLSVQQNKLEYASSQQMNEKLVNGKQSSVDSLREKENFVHPLQKVIKFQVSEPEDGEYIISTKDIKLFSVLSSTKDSSLVLQKKENLCKANHSAPVPETHVESSCKNNNSTVLVQTNTFPLVNNDNSTLKCTQEFREEEDPVDCVKKDSAPPCVEDAFLQMDKMLHVTKSKSTITSQQHVDFSRCGLFPVEENVSLVESSTHVISGLSQERKGKKNSPSKVQLLSEDILTEWEVPDSLHPTYHPSNSCENTVPGSSSGVELGSGDNGSPEKDFTTSLQAQDRFPATLSMDDESYQNTDLDMSVEIIDTVNVSPDFFQCKLNFSTSRQAQDRFPATLSMDDSYQNTDSDMNVEVIDPVNISPDFDLRKIDDKAAVETRNTQRSQNKKHKKVFESSGGSVLLELKSLRLCERRAVSTKNKMKKAADSKKKTVSSKRKDLQKSNTDPLKVKKASAIPVCRTKKLPAESNVSKRPINRPVLELEMCSAQKSKITDQPLKEEMSEDSGVGFTLVPLSSPKQAQPESENDQKSMLFEDVPEQLDSDLKWQEKQQQQVFLFKGMDTEYSCNLAGNAKLYDNDKAAVETRNTQRSRNKKHKKVFESSGGSVLLELKSLRLCERRAVSTKNKMKKAADSKKKTVSSKRKDLQKSNTDPLKVKRASAIPACRTKKLPAESNVSKRPINRPGLELGMGSAQKSKITDQPLKEEMSEDSGVGFTLVPLSSPKQTQPDSENDQKSMLFEDVPEQLDSDSKWQNKQQQQVFLFKGMDTEYSCNVAGNAKLYGNRIFLPQKERTKYLTTRKKFLGNMTCLSKVIPERKLSRKSSQDGSRNSIVEVSRHPKPCSECVKATVKTRNTRKSQHKKHKKIFESSGRSVLLEMKSLRLSEKRAVSTKNKIKKAAESKKKTVSSNTMCLLKSNADPLKEKKASATPPCRTKELPTESNVSKCPINRSASISQKGSARESKVLISSQKELMSALSPQMTHNSMASPVNMQSDTHTVQGVDLPPNGEQNSLSLQNEKNDTPTRKQVSPVSTREKKSLISSSEREQKPIVLPQADVTLTVPQQIEQYKEKCKSSITLRKKKANTKTLQQKEDKVVNSIQEEDSLDYLQQFKKCLISVNKEKKSPISTEKEEIPPTEKEGLPPIVSFYRIVKSIVSHQKELDTSLVVPQEKEQKLSVQQNTMEYASSQQMNGKLVNEKQSPVDSLRKKENCVRSLLKERKSQVSKLKEGKHFVFTKDRPLFSVLSSRKDSSLVLQKKENISKDHHSAPVPQIYVEPSCKNNNSTVLVQPKTLPLENNEYSTLKCVQKFHEEEDPVDCVKYNSASLCVENAFPRVKKDSVSLCVENAFPSTKKDSATLCVENAFPRVKKDSASLCVENAFPRVKKDSVSLCVENAFPSTKKDSASLCVENAFPRVKKDSASLCVENAFPRVKKDSASLCVENAFPHVKKDSASLCVENAFPRVKKDSVSLCVENAFPSTKKDSASLCVENAFPRVKKDSASLCVANAFPQINKKLHVRKPKSTIASQQCVDFLRCGLFPVEENARLLDSTTHITSGSAQGGEGKKNLSSKVQLLSEDILTEWEVPDSLHPTYHPSNSCENTVAGSSSGVELGSGDNGSSEKDFTTSLQAQEQFPATLSMDDESYQNSDSDMSIEIIDIMNVSPDFDPRKIEVPDRLHKGEMSKHFRLGAPLAGSTATDQPELDSEIGDTSILFKDVPEQVQSVWKFSESVLFEDVPEQVEQDWEISKSVLFEDIPEQLDSDSELKNDQQQHVLFEHVHMEHFSDVAGNAKHYGNLDTLCEDYSCLYSEEEVLPTAELDLKCSYDGICNIITTNKKYLKICDSKDVEPIEIDDSTPTQKKTQRS